MSRKKMPVLLRNIIILAAAALILIGFALFINSRSGSAENVSLARDFASHEKLSADADIPAAPFTVAENSRLEMILDPATLGVTLVDKASGESMKSVHGQDDDKLNTSWRGFLGSGVSIEFYSGDSPVLQRADMFNRTPELALQKTENGFRAGIVYDSLKLAFEVEVELTDSGMTARVPAESIYEGEQFRLAGIYLYPFMGASRLGEERGYLFVPEGAGGLIDLADNSSRYASPYMKKIYGGNIAVDSQISQASNLPGIHEPEEVTIPVYGVAHTDRRLAVLGIAEDGRYNAQVMAYPNGVATDYNWAAVKFLYREDYVTQLSRATGVRSAPLGGDFRDVGIRFELLSGEAAGYVGMAKAYQDYLLETGQLEKKAVDYKLRLDILGAEAKDWIVFSTVVPMTTVSQMEEMLDDLLETGVTEILPTYKGWQEKGLSRSYGEGSFRLEGKLGSLDALETLAEELKSQGADLRLHQDLLLANPKGSYDTSTDIVKGMSRNLAEKLTNKSLYPAYYYLTPQAAMRRATRFSDKFEGGVLDQLTLSGPTDTLFSYYDRGITVTRGETKAQVDEMMEQLSGFRMALEKPFDYLLNYADYYFNMPVYASNYNYISNEVPFLPMVLKGLVPYYADYLNFEPNIRHFTLKMVEFGAYPSFLLTHERTSELKDTNSSDLFTSQYLDYKPMIADYHEEFLKLSEKVGDATMVNHEILDLNVVRVTYSNGTIIVINHGNRPFQAQGLEIAPLSYQVMEVHS